jgi:phosphatidylglycerol:prolipoprotein diacylglycerol transferase
LSKFVLSWYGILLAYFIIVGLFLILRLGGGNNPVFLSLGSLSFRWYGIIITAGVIICAFLAQFLAQRRGDDPDHVWRLLPVVLIAGILVARLWYVTFTFDGYRDYLFSIGNPNHAGALEIWRGGIAIQGAVVGGTIGTLIYGWWYNRRLQQQASKGPRFSIWRFADFVAPGLVLAQAMGRWGNFMNNEAYGRETKWGWGIKIPCEYRTSGATPGTDNTLCPIAQSPQYGTPNGGIDQNALFHPTFLYESLWDYFCFLVLFYCVMKPKTIERRFRVKLRDGDIFLLYWVIYSIGRFFTEGLRTDSLFIIGGPPNGLRSAQLTAIIAILIAGFLLFYRHRKAFPITQSLSVRLAPVAVAAGAGTAVALPDETTEEVGTEVEEAEEAEKATPVAPVDQLDDDDELDDSEEVVQPTLMDESARGENPPPPPESGEGSKSASGSETHPAPDDVTHDSGAGSAAPAEGGEEGPASGESTPAKSQGE